LYGKCLGGSQICPRLQDRKCLTELKRDYHFYLALENSICKDYATEKLKRAIMHVTIPIVLSRDSVENIIPHSAFIAVDDFSSAEGLASYMKYLMRNKTAYAEYFGWRVQDNPMSEEDYHAAVVATEEIEMPCALCRKLHEDKRPKYYRNLADNMQNGGYLCRKLSRGLLRYAR
jgi:hypothetical protein